MLHALSAYYKEKSAYVYMCVDVTFIKRTRVINTLDSVL